MRNLCQRGRLELNAICVFITTSTNAVPRRLSNEWLIHYLNRWIVIIRVLLTWSRKQTLVRSTFPPSKEKTSVSNMFNTAWSRETSLLTQHSRDDYILCLSLNTFAIDLSANRMMYDVFELFNQFVTSLFLTQSILVDFQITLDVINERRAFLASHARDPLIVLWDSTESDGFIWETWNGCITPHSRC